MSRVCVLLVLHLAQLIRASNYVPVYCLKVEEFKLTYVSRLVRVNLQQNWEYYDEEVYLDSIQVNAVKLGFDSKPSVGRFSLSDHYNVGQNETVYLDHDFYDLLNASNFRLSQAAFWITTIDLLSQRYGRLTSLEVNNPRVLWNNWWRDFNTSTLSTIRIIGVNLGPEFSLKYQTDLKTLELRNAGIKKILPETFNAASDLEEINLSGNRLTGVPAGISKLSASLEKFNLSGQDVSAFRLSNSELADLYYLKSIDLSDMNIRDAIITKNLEKLDRLEILRLHNCNINYITRLYFDEMQSLKELILSNNGLSLWPDMKHLKLKHLDLSNNKLETINKEKVPSMNNGLLNLSKNRITSINSDALNFQIYKLDLSSNKIKVINEDILHSFNEIRVIDLSDNPFNCDCDNKDFLRWFKKERDLKFKNINHVRCSSPVSLYSVPLKLVKVDHIECYNSINLLIIKIGMPLGFIVFFVVCVCSVAYHYRHKLYSCYMLHNTSSTFDTIIT